MTADSVHDIAELIDHALLAPAMTDAEIEAGCRMALRHGVASVCVKPSGLMLCVAILRGSGVAPSTVIGFPHGAHTPETKLAEALQACRDGAREIDVVANYGKALSGEWNYVHDELAAVAAAARAAAARVKVIFENCWLADEQKAAMCDLCERIAVDFAKTSTGFGPGGATEEDVRLMRARLPASIGVKASGGIRTLDGLLAMRRAGASRIGTSSTAAILAEAERRMAQAERGIPR